LIKIFTTIFLLIIGSTGFAIADTDYQLHAELIAKNTYVFIGKKEDFSMVNGGNILNTAFIVTNEGVVLIDSGPSYQYALQAKAAINEITDKPVIKIFITHSHPDHFLGNQVFPDASIYALPTTIRELKTNAESFLDNVYRLADYWMAGTEVSINSILPLNSTSELIGEHSLRYLFLKGHTAADLAILDETTGVLFTGDLVFHNRAATTPHANIEAWLLSLDKLEQIRFNLLVPGHGEVTGNISPIKQTREYLTWLDVTIKRSVMDGLSMNEVINLPVPEQFQNLAVLKSEFMRSVIHRYPIYEKTLFEQIE